MKIPDRDVWKRRNCELSPELIDKLQWAIKENVSFRLYEDEGMYSFIATLPSQDATMLTEVPLEQKELAKFNQDLDYALMSLHAAKEYHDNQ